MPSYEKFLKELVRNKHKLEHILAAFLSDESFAMIQNKFPPKLGDPGSFLIPCTFRKSFSCNALADLDAGINLMPYSLYAKLSLETLKPTKISPNWNLPFELMSDASDFVVGAVLGQKTGKLSPIYFASKTLNCKTSDSPIRGVGDDQRTKE
ncbi:reverse transcriptase domain-containing protein [Tanacetum coccineum]